VKASGGIRNPEAAKEMLDFEGASRIGASSVFSTFIRKKIMKLIVAGYNIDSSLIAALEDQNATPEVIFRSLCTHQSQPKKR